MTGGVDAVRAVTFGCRLNAVESDAMTALATAAGHRATTIVNTCAVTAEATRQARQAIRRLKRQEPTRAIVVTGCAAEIERAAFAAMPEVDRLVRNRDKATAAAWGHPASAEPPAAVLPHTRGFVEVQNGCDHRCTFCIIPVGRGASRSVPGAAVIDRVRALVEQGARDVVLTGVDLTAYGVDQTGRPGLGALVRTLLAAIPDLPRLRLSSLDCVEADPLLIDAIGTEPRLMPHLHLSLQSGSDLLLKRMKRRHGRADAIGLCAALRRARPDLVFGADFITGFPTESDAMFADSLALVEECGLTHLHVFPYSPRPGTPASRMPQVAPRLARERAARLRDAGGIALGRHLASQRGRAVRVLMERGGRGRCADFTSVRPCGAPPPGTFADVLVEGHDDRDLLGVVIGR